MNILFLRFFILIIEAFALNLAIENWYFLQRDDKYDAHVNTGVGSLIVARYTSTSMAVS